MRKAVCLYFLAAGLLSGGSHAFAQKTTLAVSYLNSNTTNPEASWISKGMADMLTTDLAKISALTVVQREQLDKVLKEQALGASGAVDPGKAAQLGKLLGAQQLVSGSYAAIGRNVRVDLQLVDVQSGKVNSGITAEGSIDSIFTLEKQLVLALISKLGVTPTASEIQSIMQAETYNNQAVILNYQGLSQIQTDPKAAAVALKQAVALDPNYLSAQQNLKTALRVTGQSLANSALLELDAKQIEVQLMPQVANIILSNIQTEVELGKPKTNAGDPSLVTLKVNARVGLKDGTYQQIVKLLLPYSKEGEGRSTINFSAPGIGRGNQQRITLSNEAWSALIGFLENYEVYLAFYGDGPSPIYIDGPGSQIVANYFLTGDQGSISPNHYGEIGMKLLPPMSEFGSPWFKDITVPIELLKHFISSQPILFSRNPKLTDDEKNNRKLLTKEFSFMYIDSATAKDLGVPAGYVRDDTECVYTKGNGSDWSMSDLPDSWDNIIKLKNCIIYTKINDADFNPELLKQKIDAGENFSITLYEQFDQKFQTRSRRNLVNKQDFKYDAFGGKFNYPLYYYTGALENHSNPRYPYYKFLKANSKLKSFKISLMF
ncbi:CsgG/HfaB family protein [Deinococcus cavernae]|nr:CsgG/HfaB family protein [Deinococcus cavernae]